MSILKNVPRASESLCSSLKTHYVCQMVSVYLQKRTKGISGKYASLRRKKTTKKRPNGRVDS